LTLGWPVWTAALPVENLYEAEVAVSDQSPQQQEAGIATALTKVLAKVSGRREIPAGPALGEVLKDAAHAVRQYGYERPEGAAAEGLLLRVRFEPSLVDERVRRLGLPLWGGNRPGVLVWIALNPGGGPQLWQPELEPALREGLERAAFERGIPLLFPLLDLEDQARLSVQGLWAGQAEAILAASARYAPEAVLVGRLRRLPDEQWLGGWSLLLSQQTESWESPPKEAAAQGYEAVQGAADRLAARLAPAGGGAGAASVRVLLSIRGIASVADYARLRGLLGGLNSVAGSTVRRVEPDAMHYEVEVRGGVAVLENELALRGGLLKETPEQAEEGTEIASEEPSAEAETITHLYYRLQP